MVQQTAEYFCNFFIYFFFPERRLKSHIASRAGFAACLWLHRQLSLLAGGKAEERDVGWNKTKKKQSRLAYFFRGIAIKHCSGIIYDVTQWCNTFLSYPVWHSAAGFVANRRSRGVTSLYSAGWKPRLSRNKTKTKTRNQKWEIVFFFFLCFPQNAN